MNEADGQLHSLSVLEQLREASKCLWGASSEAYFRVDELLRELANSNLHDIPRIEMWDQSDQRAVRCSLGNLSGTSKSTTKAATSSVTATGRHSPMSTSRQRPGGGPQRAC